MIKNTLLWMIVNRLLAAVPTLLVISLLVFIIIELPPGDYLESYISELRSQGQLVDQQKVMALRQEYGLDQPFYMRYVHWVSGLVVGDLGYSFAFDVPVKDLIGDRFLITVILNVTTIAFIWMIAFPIGVYSAMNQYSKGDYILSFIGFLGFATPNFLLALILMYLGKAYFGIDLGGIIDEEYIDAPWSIGKIGSVLSHLLVPIIIIGTAGTAAMIRRLRANLLDELQKPYVQTAYIKGLKKSKAVVKYPLRVALIPFISDIGHFIPQIVSGSAIISAVLSLPTTGKMLLDALLQQDMYLAGSFLMFLALLTIIGTLISDILLILLDPRIGYERTQR